MQIQDVDNLARLARINLSDEEKAKFLHDMEGILTYVAQVQEVASDNSPRSFDHINSVREDVATTETGSKTKVLVDQFPDHEGDYLKVKKIM